MKTFCIIALAALSFAASANARDYDPGGRIVVACASDHAPRMSEVAGAVERSHYWAGQAARREMLELAREACAAGAARAVVFVPEADQRYGAVGIVTVAER